MTLLLDGPSGSATTVLLAHGAGAAMDSPFMTAVAGALAAEGLRVARFEFAYMAARREGTRKPPPRADTLIAEYREAIAALDAPGRLIVGGKSMGGRVASLMADDLFAESTAAGLLCLGYPFHPSGKPEKTRTDHLAVLRMPTLVCQGTRDPLGNREEVAGYSLSPAIEVLWLEDGDHDLKPRKTVTGLTAADHIATVARAVAEWSGRLS